MRYILTKVYVHSALILSLISLISCKKLIEVDLPIDKNTAETVYDNTGSAVAVINGIYANMAIDNPALFTGEGSISLGTALMSDELQLNEGGNALYNNTTNINVWEDAYGNFIFRINAFIEGVNSSKNIPNETKNKLLAEARFLRAFVYFYLVNFYGDVPLVTTTDSKVNSNIIRTTSSDIYKFIIDELKYAQQALSDDYLAVDMIATTTERIRPTKASASALLARVYLYLGEWSSAAEESTKVIDNNRFELLGDLTQVFVKNSRETIWQLQTQLSVSFDGIPNTRDGKYLIPFDGAKPIVSMSTQLMASFDEDQDKRTENWIKKIKVDSKDYFVPFKYREGPESTVQREYLMVFRLAEQYLIRAEARVHNNNLVGANSAESDLNMIRRRAGLEAINQTTASGLLNAIAKERQRELFIEWGNRWLDLKRLNKLDKVMQIVCPLKGGIWEPFRKLFMIPYDDFRKNKALKGHQNPGYLEPGT